ncbi:MAG: hypothetical protein ACK4YP_01695 [Myxococcota bacterium]
MPRIADHSFTARCPVGAQIHLDGGAVSTSLPTARGTGTTGQPLASEQEGSFFTPVVGFGGAVPSGGTDVDAWAIPYTGVNLYFAPIDRDVSLDDIGPAFSRQSLWRRRFGVTLGVAMYKPVMNVPGRADRGLLGDDVTLLLGGTYRVTRFTNVTAFAVPYKLADDNPLDERGRIEAAFGLAFSFDADVWSAIEKITP